MRCYVIHVWYYLTPVWHMLQCMCTCVRMCSTRGWELRTYIWYGYYCYQLGCTQKERYAKVHTYESIGG